MTQHLRLRLCCFHVVELAKSWKLCEQKLGYKEHSAELMMSILRPSLINLYENHWQHFVWYCQHKNINVFAVHSPEFWHYLVVLFDDTNSASTVISLHTSILSVLRPQKYEPATAPDVTHRDLAGKAASLQNQATMQSAAGFITPRPLWLKGCCRHLCVLTQQNRDLILILPTCCSLALSQMVLPKGCCRHLCVVCASWVRECYKSTGIPFWFTKLSG